MARVSKGAVGRPDYRYQPDQSGGSSRPKDLRKNQMHAECERAKADLARRLEDTKTRGGADAKPLKEALKSFDRGYGPLLEKCGDAVAKHKLNDVKKYAADALKVAQKYLPAVRSLPGGNGNLAAAVLPDRIEKFRTPDVVEFAVSPQVGQAVLACPTREALAIERNGSAHFPRRAEIAGRHQEF